MAIMMSNDMTAKRMNNMISWNEVKTIITNKLIANWINFCVVHFLNSVRFVMHLLLNIETEIKNKMNCNLDFDFERCLSLFAFFFFIYSSSWLMWTNQNELQWKSCISRCVADNRFLHIIIANKSVSCKRKFCGWLVGGVVRSITTLNWKAYEKNYTTVDTNNGLNGSRAIIQSGNRKKNIEARKNICNSACLFLASTSQASELNGGKLIDNVLE